MNRFPMQVFEPPLREAKPHPSARRRLMTAVRRRRYLPFCERLSLLSVSSRTLAIDAAHPGPFSDLVSGRADAINQVRIVPHQPQ